MSGLTVSKMPHTRQSHAIKQHTEISGLWTQELDAGLWMLDSEPWTMNSRRWTPNIEC